MQFLTPRGARVEGGTAPEYGMDVGRDSKLVFILGNHRSGTTLLYNALVETGPFCHPTPYHLAYFHDYVGNAQFDPREALARTKERFERKGIVDRFVDGIPAHALSPEEYGFVLKRGRLSSKTLDTFHDFCNFVRSSAEAHQRLLLKNPRDFTNFRFIRRCFPGAKFIFIHRHPGPTIDSRIRELRLLFSRRSPYQAEIEPRYDSIMSRRILRGAIHLSLRLDRLLTLCFLLAFHRNASRFLRAVRGLPEDTYISTTYERLCTEPEAVVGSILGFLGLRHYDASRVSEMVRLTSRKVNRNTTLRSAMAARLLRPYLDYCGYEGLWPGERTST